MVQQSMNRALWLSQTIEQRFRGNQLVNAPHINEQADNQMVNGLEDVINNELVDANTYPFKDIIINGNSDGFAEIDNVQPLLKSMQPLINAKAGLIIRQKSLKYAFNDFWQAVQEKERLYLATEIQ
uniref:Uncharacterized protein n=1 Tax=Romanomermis culicivorax TaxID=13658 RepID=A0A915LB13_ROMCU